MKATIIVQSPNPTTYSNAMAAMITQYPMIREFDFAFYGDQDDESLLKLIENDLSTSSKHEAYVRAGRPARSKSKISAINNIVFSNSAIIDVSGASKEVLAEVMTVALVSGQSVGFQSWRGNDRVGRKHVGLDEYDYFDAMKSRIVKKIYKSYKINKIVYLILSFILISLVAFYVAQEYFLINLITDKLINFLGITVGIGGLILSKVALDQTPFKGRTEKQFD